MWVMTPNGNRILEAKRIEVEVYQNNEGATTYSVVAYNAVTIDELTAASVRSPRGIGRYVLALYPDEQTAKNVLEDILSAIEAGKTVYRFKSVY